MMVKQRTRRLVQGSVHPWVCLAVALLIVGCLSNVALACPTCKNGLHDEAAIHIARSYMWSILFMMSMPFLIIGGLGTYFYILVRRARKQQAALGLSPTPLPGSVATTGS